MGQIIKWKANNYTVVNNKGEVVKVEFYTEYIEEKWWVEIFLDGVHFTRLSFDKLGEIEEYLNHFCEEL